MAEEQKPQDAELKPLNKLDVSLYDDLPVGCIALSQIPMLVEMGWKTPAKHRDNVGVASAPGTGKTSTFETFRSVDDPDSAPDPEQRRLLLQTVVRSLYGDTPPDGDPEQFLDPKHIPYRTQVLILNAASLNGASVGGVPILDGGTGTPEDIQKIVRTIEVALSKELASLTEEGEVRRRREEMAKLEPGSPEWTAWKDWKAPRAILVIDDFHALPPALMPFFLPIFDGKRAIGMFGDAHLRDNVQAWQLMNAAEYGVRETARDAAISNRIVRLRGYAIPRDVIEYMETSQHHEAVTDYLKAYPMHANPMQGAPGAPAGGADDEAQKLIREGNHFPSSRVWTHVSYLMKQYEESQDPVWQHLIRSKIFAQLGERYGTHYLKWIDSVFLRNLPSAYRFLDAPELIDPYIKQPDKLAMILDELVQAAATGQAEFDNVVDVAKRLPTSEQWHVLWRLANHNGEGSSLMPYVLKSRHRGFLEDWIKEAAATTRQAVAGTTVENRRRANFRL